MPKILVIDDAQPFRLYLMTLLERAGYQPYGLASGDGVDLAMERERFDAVITDLYMPVVDGIETVRRVKQLAPTMPVIGISGGSMGSDDPCVKAMSILGAEAVLAKPVDAPALLAALERAIARNAPDKAADLAAPKDQALCKPSV